jgi:hypothetical protein
VTRRVLLTHHAARGVEVRTRIRPKMQGERRSGCQTFGLPGVAASLVVIAPRLLHAAPALTAVSVADGPEQRRIHDIGALALGIVRESADWQV